METQETIPLKEYFEKILEEKDKAINIALAAAKEAVGVAETNAEKWRSNANEWRGAMNDREKSFVTRKELWGAVLAIAGLAIGAISLFK